MDKQAVDEIKQHFGIVAEGLESKIDLIAEGHAVLRSEMKASIGEVKTEVRDLRSEVDVVKHEVGGLNSKVGDLQSDVDVVKSEVGGLRSEVGELRSEVDVVKGEVGGLRTEVGGLRSEVGELKSDVGTFRSEVKQDFSDVRSMIKLSYAEIDTRIGNLERDLADLKARVERVEAAVR